MCLMESCQGLPFTHDGVGFHPTGGGVTSDVSKRGVILNPLPLPSALWMKMYIWTKSLYFDKRIWGKLQVAKIYEVRLHQKYLQQWMRCSAVKRHLDESYNLSLWPIPQIRSIVWRQFMSSVSSVVKPVDYQVTPNTWFRYAACIVTCHSKYLVVVAGCRSMLQCDIVISAIVALPFYVMLQHVCVAFLSFFVCIS